MSVENEFAKKPVQFGPFELQLNTGELRKGGTKLKLQGKSFQILQALLERPGEVVTRDELKRRLWPGDTFVDLESGLNTAANRLRLALSDSAENPRFIETVARSGYRFIGEFAEVTQNLQTSPARLAFEPATPPPSVVITQRPARSIWLASALVVVAMLVSMAFWTASHHSQPQPSFRQITYRRGAISNARFGPDGQTVLYSAMWDGGARQLFIANTVSPESRELELGSAKLAGVSATNELALLTSDSAFPSSTLSRVPLNGGAPLVVAKGVDSAEWGTGGSLVVIKTSNAGSAIEYPIGKMIYRSDGVITDLRLSPQEDALAFLEHPVKDDDAGFVMWMDLKGNARQISDHWASAGGLAWAPSGREVWFTAGPTGVRRTLYATTRYGRVRQIATLPSMLTLYDISKAGRVLLGIDSSRLRVSGRFGVDRNERDLSWFDWSHVQDISRDGNTLLLDETGDGGGPSHSVYVRHAGVDKAVRLGDGLGLGLSPDGRWALAASGKRGGLSLLPTGPDAPRSSSKDGFQYCWARYFPDGQRLVVGGHFPGKPLHLFIQPAAGDELIPLKPDVYVDHVQLSPDGNQIAGLNKNRNIVIVSLSNGNVRELELPFPASAVQWTVDGKALFLRDLTSWIPARIVVMDLATSKIRPWKELAPADRVGLYYIMNVVMTPDSESYAYSYLRVLSELFVIDGWS